MAKPDCDDGWIKKAVELEAAVAFADFTKLAQVLLRYAFSQMFGAGDRPRLCQLNCTEIAGRIGRTATFVHRARRELVASGVLVQSGPDPDVFRFVKDYEKWVMVARRKASFYPTPEPRLTPQEIADCKDSPAYSRAFNKKTNRHASTINLDHARINLDHEDRINLDHDSGSIETITHGQSGPQFMVQIDPISSPPYVPPSRKRDLERERREEQEELDGVSGERGANDVDPVLAPPSPATTADRLVAWVQELILKAEYPDKIAADAASLCRRWTAKAGDTELCAASFQEAVDARTLDPVPYAEKILLRLWHAQKRGEPVEAPAICSFRADPDAPTLAPTPATKLTKPQRDAAQIARYGDSFKRLFSSTEATNGQS